MLRFEPEIVWTKGYEDTPYISMIPCEKGEYVKYDDVLVMMERMTEQLKEA